MTRLQTSFWLALGIVALIAGLTLFGWYAAALGVGVGAGVLFFLRGQAQGGSLGNARRFEKKPADLSSRLGTLFAAMGIASAALGHDPPYPLSFRVMFLGFLVVAGIAAVVLAIPGPKPP